MIENLSETFKKYRGRFVIFYMIENISAYNDSMQSYGYKDIQKALKEIGYEQL